MCSSMRRGSFTARITTPGSTSWNSSKPISAYHAWARRRIAAKRRQGRRMNWDRIERNWKVFKANAKRHWVKLSDEQLDLVAGKRDQLVRKIEQVYGISTEMAERQLAAWQSAQRESSPFK